LLAHIVVEQQFPADVIDVQLVWLDIGRFVLDLVDDFIFFANDCCARV